MTSGGTSRLTAGRLPTSPAEASQQAALIAGSSPNSCEPDSLTTGQVIGYPEITSASAFASQRHGPRAMERRPGGRICNSSTTNHSVIASQTTTQRTSPYIPRTGALSRPPMGGSQTPHQGHRFPQVMGLSGTASGLSDSCGV